MKTQLKTIKDAEETEHENLSFVHAKDGRVRVRINDKPAGYIFQRKGGISWRNNFDGTKRYTVRVETRESFLAIIDALSGGAFIPKETETKPVSKAKPEPEAKPEVKKPAENKNKTKFIETNKEISKLEYAIDNQKNVLLKGPTGCGKSFLIDELAKVHDKRLHVINCDIELDKSELIGHYIIVDGEKGPVSVWIPGIIPVAMENGDWVVFDEVNMAKAEVLSSMHQAMDHRRQITIKEHNNEVVKAHEDFRLFACINPEYAGTSELNYAFRRRFNNIIDMTYLKRSKELGLIMLRTKISNDKAQKLVSIANDTRDLQKQGKLEQPVSTAHLLEFAEMIVKTNFSEVECARVTLNLTDEFGEQEDILNIVKNYFY